MSKIARVRGIEMAYNDEGEGAPVVFLHGFPFNRSMWREQADALRATCRVVAPDLRGHGGTTAVGEPATMEEVAEDVAALLDVLGIGRAIVCGLSMGGYVTLAFFRKYAGRVRALVLADARAQARRGRARARDGARHEARGRSRGAARGGAAARPDRPPTVD